MRSKPKKSDCGFCDTSCNNEWCISKVPREHTADEPLWFIEAKEELERKKRTESEQFIYDLIRMHGGGICD